MKLGIHETIYTISVTRFGDFSPLWQNLKRVRQFFEGVFKIMNLLWPILYVIRPIYVVLMVKY